MPTDVMIVGDSHTRALQAGCQAAGLNSEILTFSGTAWFEADVQYRPQTGLHSPRRKWVADASGKLGARVGTPNPFKSGVPVLLSCMNLGRMLGSFRWKGHQYARDLTPGEADLPVSRAALEAYVEHQAESSLSLIRALTADGAHVVVVAPPNFTGLHQAQLATATFAQAVRALDVACFNPWEHQEPGAMTLPKAYVHEDRRHGNDAYGRWVIDLLVDTGLLPVRQPS
ncbi:hypothetical protein [Aliiroseovarius sp.]|uniref:hypothetical protein n=1 Tax=Aliiroseovarius sp. TaxID=1872442 RepID=UPI003BAD165A